jgi:hypothetical protein
MGAGDFKGGQVVYFTPVVDQSNPACTGASPDCSLYTPLGGTPDCVGGWCRPATGTFGNIQRNSYTGPGEFLSDMSIFKNFQITERVKAQFQAEFFNVFNHPVLNKPNNCIDCSGGGIINTLEPDTLMRQFQIGLRVNF